ncbi:MAG: hypothetical protein CM1200mP41_25840 [Gammaproteobacteria bacterium]|nr:MAG: hypothetical protein CM1200mP41_25840 [Gammaproteobacteria bacterium]
MAEADVAALLEVGENTPGTRIGLSISLDDLLVLLHDICLYQIAPDAVDAKALDVDVIAELPQLKTAGGCQLFYQFGLLGKADLPLAPDPATGFEMALLRCCCSAPILREGKRGL